MHQHRNLLEYAFFYFLQSVVAAVEHFFGSAEVAVKLAAYTPWKFEKRFQIGILHAVVGSLRVEALQFVEFFLEMCRGFFGHSEF